jgi:hypothetical protein
MLGKRAMNHQYRHQGLWMSSDSSIKLEQRAQIIALHWKWFEMQRSEIHSKFLDFCRILLSWKDSTAGGK